MTEVKQGRRHSLILYKRSIDRLWMPVFPLGLLLSAGMWFSGRYWQNIGFVPSIPSPYDFLIYTAIVLIFAFTFCCWIVRNMAYVQAKKDHIRIVTPFLATNISYRRLVRAYPGQVGQIFKPGKVKNSILKLIEDYEGKTAIVIEMKGYPLSPTMLRLFLGEAMLYPESEGLVLLIPDWMGFSTEIESLQGSWKQKQNRYKVEPNSSYGLMQSLRKK